MLKGDAQLDQSLEKAVESRRSAEAARKARIFNTRLRVMGLDLDALNQQIKEKKQQENKEKLQSEAFETLIKSQDEALLQQDINEKEKRQALQKDLTHYWATKQKLNTQDGGWKNGLQGAFDITIPEAKLGPASMQKFQGEDVNWKQMRKEQVKMTERDLKGQMDENIRRQEREKDRDMLEKQEMLHQNQEQLHQDALEEERKKAARIALYSFNQALAAERVESLKEQHRREERENLAEMWHTMTSDMLTECADAGERDVGGGKPPQILPDRWKGMRPEQLRSFQREREQQCREKQRQSDAAKIEEAAWNLQQLTFSRKAEEEEIGKAEKMRELRIQLDRHNMQLTREQQAHQEYLNKKLYTNKPTKDYFHQFNTSSR
ncbi:RIB43A-like with coiled-coils protein 1 [Oryzias melastigma]|uniref:RIB43A-like with coiled-coils protein 1 n=1 Tax=Oryzias melastigma TaxID=30732 RepID=UPI000CF80C4C|nr:RIB43A-like with coiled-coils protein 1 [Oryzias melastigma]XP_024149864.1 RIB43A-like with coiled-coils protein 1 [Oryzias melastigma]XP_024149865.1 RIB43A-like with coiled-coils protein 1 [Oryzias melastigma]